MSKLIYLACPYTNKDKVIMEYRFTEVTRLSAYLAKRGIANISPITQSHLQSEYYNHGTDWNAWKDIDAKLIKVCDELWVYQLPGWEKSKGISEECKLAVFYGIPIKWVRCSFLLDYTEALVSNHKYISDSEIDYVI